jgi:protein-S-isoprenylcysteine O-methyltransferase Ste14
MIPARRHRRSWFERISMRILATGGIIGIDVALGAILTANHVHGWIEGLVIGVVSVVLAAILWSSRQL